jgi:hypothetical protein
VALDIQSITKSLCYWVGGHTQGTLVLPNTYVLGTRWECDVLHVTKAFYYAEYEIKLSLADYARDFAKRYSNWRSAPRKHEVYASKKKMEFRGKPFTKPRRFIFVTSLDLLDTEVIPAHCGHVTFEDSSRGIRFKWQRKPPSLSYATKLSPEAVFNLAVKSNSRAWEAIRAADLWREKCRSLTDNIPTTESRDE